MSIRRSLSRRLLTATVVVASAATSAVLVADPAQALNSAHVKPTNWAYTDSAEPDNTFTGVDVEARIGSRTDATGVIHTSRAYFTWDLSAYVGATVSLSVAVAKETAVNDCASERRIHFWEATTPTGPITWNNPPAEVRRVATFTPAIACPAPYMEFDVTGAVRRALRGDGILTLEVRVPENAESKVAFGRSLANSLGIQLGYNKPPNPPSDLRVYSTACGAEPLLVNTLRPILVAYVSDPDGTQDWLTATFQLWPAGNPDQVSEYRVTGGPSHAQVSLTPPAGVLVDGGKYVFKVKVDDGQVDSKPSPACRFTVDVTHPTAAPTVTSSDYPADGAEGPGGPGIPGTFTFSAGGDKDITGFSYGLIHVAADRPGGTATVSITPTQPGPVELLVHGTDRAGNLGPATTYSFFVPSDEPAIVDSNPEGNGNQPRTLVFSSRLRDVVSYVYTFNDNPPATVAAAADGTASLVLPASVLAPGFNRLWVRSIGATGYQSAEGQYGFYLSSAPLVTSSAWTIGDDVVGAPAGTTGTFTFSPMMGTVTSYSWHIDSATPETVTADADGTATVSYTPSASGYHSISVVGQTTDGDTEEFWAYFRVG